MARRDDRSNTTPSTSDQSANQTTSATMTTEPLGTLGPTGTEPLGPGPMGTGSMGPGPMGSDSMEPGRMGFDRQTGTPGDWRERGNEGGHGVEGAKQELKDLASQAKDQTVRAAGQAKSQVSQLVDRQKGQVADRLGSLAGVLREAGQRLDERESEGYGRYADRAAVQVERVSDYLRRQDLNNFVHDVEGFARRHPDVFLGGALIAGVLLARFLKASAEREPWEGYPQSAYASTPYQRYGEGYGTGSRYGAATGTYDEPYATSAGGL